MKIYFLIFILSINFAFTKTFQVEAINKDGLESMLFKPGYIKIAIGDSIEFTPKAKDHTTKSVFTPKGATPWSSDPGKKFTYTFTKEGVYIYECKNHYIMGMNGVIQVGKAVNKDQATAFLKKYKKKIPIKKNRIDLSFNKVE